MFDGFLSVTSDIADDIHDIDNQGRSIERDENAHPSPEPAVNRSFREPRPKEVEQRDPKDVAEPQEAGEASEPGQDRHEDHASQKRADDNLGLQATDEEERHDQVGGYQQREPQSPVGGHLHDAAIELYECFHRDLLLRSVFKPGTR